MMNKLLMISGEKVIAIARRHLMSEMVGVSGIQRGRIVHGLVVGGERVGVVVMKPGAVMLLIGDKMSGGQKSVDREGIVGSVACCRRRAEVHLVQLHRRAAVDVERGGRHQAVPVMQ